MFFSAIFPGESFLLNILSVGRILECKYRNYGLFSNWLKITSARMVYVEAFLLLFILTKHEIVTF